MIETGITDVVDALHSGDRSLVTAASLGRLWQHVQDLDQQHFALLTSDRKRDSEDETDRTSLKDPENQKRFKTLTGLIRKMGYGYVKLIDHWLECSNDKIRYKDCPDDLMTETVERSAFIPGMRLNEAIKLGKKFNQDAIIYGGPDAGGNIILHFRVGGGTEKIGNKFSPRAIGQGYSEIGNRTDRKFSFLSYPTGSPMSAMAASVYETAAYGTKLYNSVTGGRLV